MGVIYTVTPVSLFLALYHIVTWSTRLGVYLPADSTTAQGVWDSHVKTCVYEDHLLTDRDWFGYLANITILNTGRLTFEFHYPADKCCQNILFYSEDQLSIINARMNCWQKEYLLRPEDDQILRLTPRFSWSGCHMTHPNGVATYVCKGGRSFTVEQSEERPITWYIAASNCATLHGLDLRYRMEVFGHVGECRNMYSRVDDMLPALRDSSGHHDVIESNEINGHPPDRDEPKVVSLEQESMTAGNRELGRVCVVEGNLNTSDNWYGYLANMTLKAGGGFYFRISFPYSMQPMTLMLYTEEDLIYLSPDRTCGQKDGVIRGSHVKDQVITLNYRASWYGCISRNHSHGRNLTCESVKRYPDKPRKFFMAINNCRSTTGLLVYYRLEIFGYLNNPCRGASTPSSLTLVAIGLATTLVNFVTSRGGFGWIYCRTDSKNLSSGITVAGSIVVVVICLVVLAAIVVYLLASAAVSVITAVSIFSLLFLVFV